MKQFRTGVIVLLVVFVLATSFAACGNKGWNKKQQKGNAEKPTSLVAKDGKFKILQFTDTHLISNGTNDLDDQTLRWMKEAVEKTQPDLVELTGDITGSGTAKRDAGILAIANMFEGMGQYWAYSFGNHDGEWSKEGGITEKFVGKIGVQTKVEDVNPSIKEDPKYVEASKKYDLVYGDNTLGNQEIFDQLAGYKYCLSRQDPSEKEETTRAAMGVGNYTIDLVDNDGNLVYALIHMDTHGKMYSNPIGNDIRKNPDAAKDAGYVGLTDAQIEWYEGKAAEYAEKGIKTAVFMHIPHYGFREATEDYTEHSQYGIPQFKEKENIEDVVRDQLFNDLEFVKEEGVYACRWEDGLETAIDKYKTTNLIAVGHDHNNCFYLRRNIGEKYMEDGETDNEIVIAYGRCSGVNAWGRKINIGATVYEIDTNKEELSDMYKISVFYPEFDYIQEFKGSEIHCEEPHLN